MAPDTPLSSTGPTSRNEPYCSAEVVEQETGFDA
jgi:hypothetical protein